MKEDSLKKRYSIKLFTNLIAGLISSILIAIVPKALGPIAYGQFFFLQDFFMKVIGFFDMGSSTAFFTKLSARNTRKELITFYFIYSLIILCFIFGLIFILDIFDLMFYILPDMPNEYIYFGLFFGFFTWFTKILIKISDAYALTVLVELIKIGHKILSLFLLLYFIYSTSFDLHGYFTFHYISLFSFFLILIWLFKIKGIFYKNILNIKELGFKKILKEFIEYCHPLFIYSVIGIIAGLFDIWLLQNTAGSEQTGFYGLAYSLAAMCFVFTSAMTPLITREFAKSYEQKDLATIRKLFFRYIPMLYSISAYFAVFVSVQSENVLMIFTDEEFKNAYLVLVMMALYPIHQTYGQLSGSLFYATGQTKLMRNIAMFTAPLGMAISFGMIYLLDLGAVGLAYKMIIGQLIGVNIQLYFNAKLLDFKMKYFLYHQVYAILFFIVLGIVSSNTLEFSSPIVDFMFSGFFYTILVVIFTCIFPQVFATSRSNIKKLIF
jgi:O-antigen/teichoic acid export membrane protein